MVRSAWLLLLYVGFLGFGCAGQGNKEKTSKSAFSSTGGSNGKPIVTPGNSLIGKVASVNPGARFVVLNFPIGHLPTLQQHLFVYRKGLKVAELKVTGPQMDDNIVADIVTGESEPGDDVKER
jgi:hypothetical protein